MTNNRINKITWSHFSFFSVTDEYLEVSGFLRIFLSHHAQKNNANLKKKTRKFFKIIFKENGRNLLSYLHSNRLSLFC